MPNNETKKFHVTVVIPAWLDTYTAYKLLSNFVTHLLQGFIYAVDENGKETIIKDVNGN